MHPQDIAGQSMRENVREIVCFLLFFIGEFSRFAGKIENECIKRFKYFFRCAVRQLRCYAKCNVKRREAGYSFGFPSFGASSKGYLFYGAAGRGLREAQSSSSTNPARSNVQKGENFLRAHGSIRRNDIHKKNTH